MTEENWGLFLLAFAVVVGIAILIVWSFPNDSDDKDEENKNGFEEGVIT